MDKFFFSTIVSLTLLFSGPCPILAEALLLFPDQNLEELTLTTTNPESGAFIFYDNYGEVQEGVVGDYIGIEVAKVSQVHTESITVVTYEEYEGNNWDGTSVTLTRIVSHTIPRARVMQGGKGTR